MIPTIRTALAKFTQALQPLVAVAGIKVSEIAPLKNFDAFANEIWSQNSAASRRTNDSEDEEEDEVMHVMSDDETVGSLNMSVDDEEEPRHASFRSRSTIL